MTLDLYWRRFFATLLVSCLLHVAVVLAPYLGATVAGSRPSAHSGHDAEKARFLNATLVRNIDPAPEVASNSVAGASPPDVLAPLTGSNEPRPAQEPRLGIDVLPIPAPAYYTTDQLTRRPQPVSQPKLEVSPQLAPSFAAGKVILKLWINELGAVTSVIVENSEVPEVVSAAAAAAFAKLSFVPGEINGRAVGAMMRIEVTYEDLKPPQ